MSGTYSDLEVWQAAMELAVDLYRVTAVFPKTETDGLVVQMRRAAVSKASNIAEGKGRSSDKELVQFLCHSRGSLFEIQMQMAIAERLGYLRQKESDAIRRQTARIGQLLNGVIRSMRIEAVGGRPEAGRQKPEAAR